MKKRKVKGKTKPKIKPKVKPKVKPSKPKVKPRVKPKVKVKLKPKPKVKRVKPKVKRIKPKVKPRVRPPKPRVKVKPKVKRVKPKVKVKPRVRPPKPRVKVKPKVKPSAAEKVGEEEVLKLIRSGKKGFLQNELWKKLGIDSRACSRFLASLEVRGLIKREQETSKGIRTYRVVAVKQIPEIAKPRAVDHHLLMVKDIVAPCVGCKSECDPELCSDLSMWAHLLY